MPHPYCKENPFDLKRKSVEVAPPALPKPKTRNVLSARRVSCSGTVLGRWTGTDLKSRWYVSTGAMHSDRSYDRPYMGIMGTTELGGKESVIASSSLLLTVCLCIWLAVYVY